MAADFGSDFELVPPESPLDRLYQVTMFHPMKEDPVVPEIELVRDILFVLEGSTSVTKFFQLFEDDLDPSRGHEYQVRGITLAQNFIQRIL
jgi:hypothetical protein